MRYLKICKRLGAVISVSMLFWLASCYPTPGPDKSLAGAILGAGWGAGAGAVIGNQTGNLTQGTWVGMGFGAASGLLTGVGLDLAEGTELEQQRELDALKVQVASNQHQLMMLQSALDQRDQLLVRFPSSLRVFFDKDRASLRSGFVAELQRLAEAVKFNHYVGRIQVQGHSDDTGNTERNMRLSEARARTVATTLASQGISMDKIDVSSHGAAQPLASNETEAGRQLNRRVEVVILK